MTRPPDPAELAGKLSRRIDTYANNPGKAPLKLLHWALGQLEECTRTRAIPSGNLIEVVMAAIKDDSHPKPILAAAAPGTVAGGTGGAAGTADSAGTAAAAAAAGTTSAAGSAVAAATAAVGTVASGSGAGGVGGDTQKAASASASGSAGSGSKGKVVFTPLYGCDEGATGVGPVCSILEVTVGRACTATQSVLSLRGGRSQGCMFFSLLYPYGR